MKGILKIRAEMNDIETKHNRTMNETRRWFFEKIKKIDKPLATLIKKRERERTQTKSKMKEET